MARSLSDGSSLACTCAELEVHVPKRLASISTAFFLLLSPALADVTYVVKKGDNLYRIAQRTWPDEYRENPYACVKRIEKC